MIERLLSLVTGEDGATDRAEGDGLAADRRAATNDPAPDGGTAVADDPANAEASEPDEAVDDLVAAFPKNFHQVLHLTKAPLFVVDAEGNAVVWNEGMEELTGSDEAEARAVEEISTAWYHDGRRSMTLADKIIDTHAGRRAEATPTHREYDVERVGWVDFTLYQDESTFTDADGETRHIRFSAAPLYEDEEFVGVVEYVEDRTEDVRRQQDLEELVTELTATLSAVGEGNLDVRADPPELAHVEDDLLGVVDLLNGTLDRLEDTVSGVAEDSERLRSSTQSIADQAESITDAAAEQETALQEVAGEVSDMSASVEEIAATADGVSDSANAAVEKAETGSEAAAEAEGVMTEVAEATEGVVDDVEHLQEQVAEIDEVVEVIDDIAEQTNMLALNASIEAARADADGDGFAVVAEEVKQLAGESQDYADEIDRMVRSIQADTDRTVERLRTVNDQVHRGRGEVRTVQESIDAVVTDMDETAGGIAQVAAVTDDQADSAETVAAVVDDVVEAAEEIADSVENIAAQNTEHAELADGIDASLAQLTDDHRRD